MKNIVRLNAALRTFLALAPLGASLALATASLAQSSTGPLEPDPREPWTPDRRPVCVIPLFNGSPSNCRALSPGWYQHDDDGVPATEPERAIAKTKLINDVIAAYNDGWRRFIFSLPAGYVCGNSAFSGNQWTALPQWKKDLISTVIPLTLESLPGATVGVYGGLICSTDLDSLCTEAESNCSPVGTGCETCAGSGQQFVAYSLSGPGVVPFAENTLPWAACGHTEMFIDLAATVPADLVSWFFDPTFHGVLRLGGEAIPLAGSPGSYVPHPDYIDRVPWVAKSHGFVNPNLGGIFGPHNNYDPELTEVGLILDYEPLVAEEVISPPTPYTLPTATMREIVARGWVPWSGPAYGNPVVETRNELLKRVYGFGVISNIADFNHDGFVNPDDLADFQTAFFGHTGTRGNFVHGDVNGDTFINPDDLADFINAFFFSIPTAFDFGGPNPEYAMLP